MTLLEIENLIDAAIALVLQEVATAAGVGIFEFHPSKPYSDLLWARLNEELAPVPLDPSVSEFRTSTDWRLCVEGRLLVVEYTFDDGTQHHEVRHEIVDQFYEEVR